jgi:hypothetical protein
MAHLHGRSAETKRQTLYGRGRYDVLARGGRAAFGPRPSGRFTVRTTLVCKALFVFENNGATERRWAKGCKRSQGRRVLFETAGRFAHPRREGIEAT